MTRIPKKQNAKRKTEPRTAPPKFGAHCDCFAKVTEQLAAQGNDQEMVGSYRLAPYKRGQKHYLVARPVIETTRVMGSKKRGKTPRLIPTFCPFCGVQYPEAK